MNDSPAIIVAQLLRDLGTFTNPDDALTWPLYISSMPDGVGVEGNCAAIYDTTGVRDARTLAGKNYFRFGFQIKVRAVEYTIGHAKLSGVSSSLATQHNVSVTVGSNDYKIESITEPSPIMSLGVEEGTRRRHLFTYNGLVRVRGA